MNDWYLKPQKELKNTRKFRKIYKTDSRRLKYCKTCNTVWERCHADNKVHNYRDFPTYGIPRIECKKCIKKGVSNE